MSAMQLFYNQLNQPADLRQAGEAVDTAQVRKLLKVTQASAADLAELESGSDWVTWTTGNL